MTGSQNLFAEYRRNGSDTAFRELVNRYIDLVYSTALRLVEGDADRAQDVSQTVLVNLARKARTLPEDLHLAGWLHRDACFVAATLMRGERRRQSRERQAVEMNALQNSEADFSEVAPILDEAINELGEPDRTAILLRFFEQHDFRSVGQALGSNEDAARMRVNRALEKLETLLKRRGVTASCGALAVVLGANAVQAAPVGLAVTISTATALGGTTLAAAATATATATKVIAMTTLQKTIVTATVAVLAGAGMYEARRASNARAEAETLRQQQVPLSAQIQQLTNERDEVTRQLAALRDELDRVNRSSRELLKLRGEVGVLRRQTNDTTELRKENRKLREATAKIDPFDSLQPEQLLRAANWGTNSCRQIANRYSEAWMKEITDPRMLLKLGQALYDAGNYQNALTVFQKMESEKPGIALVWQGQMLDLLGKRDEALSLYKKAADYEVNNRHDQYGLVVDKQYIQQRMETPFTRVENTMTD